MPPGDEHRANAARFASERRGSSDCLLGLWGMKKGLPGGSP